MINQEIKNLIGKTLSVRDTQECHNCDTIIADVQFNDGYYQFLDDKKELIVGIRAKDVDKFIADGKISYTYYYSDRECDVTFLINEKK